MASRLWELPKLAEVTWIHFRFMDRKTMTRVVCVSFCACCTWCSELDDIFQMCGLIGPISSSAKEDQAGCVSCTISFQGNHVCMWVRFRVLTDILAHGKRRSNIQVVIWRAGAPWGNGCTFGALATRLSVLHHMHTSLRFRSLLLSSLVGSIWPCFKLFNSLKALGNYFLKYTSFLSKAI